MLYREDSLAANPTKKLYLDGLNRLLTERKETASARRGQYVKDILRDPERYRRDLCEMLGWPLVDYVKEGAPRVTSTLLADEETHRVLRLSFEILEGLWMSGLYFQYKEEGKHPLVLVQHGGLGTPELIAGFLGDTTNYHDMLERVIRHGLHAFAPQLLLWENRYEIPFDRKEMDAEFKRVGSSITAIEVFGLTRILDYFEQQSEVSTFGMVGLSYGGFYTLYTTAIDTRIRSAISCAFFNSRDRIGWSDWTFWRSAEKFDDAEIAALAYPRHLCIEIAKDDPLFDSRYGLASYERLRDLCVSVGTDFLDFILFDGVHEFHKDDAPIADLVRRLKNEG